MDLFGDFCDRNLLDLLLDLWYLVDCVLAFVFKFLLWRLIFCLDLDLDLYVDLRGSEYYCTVMLSIFLLDRLILLYWHAGYVDNKLIQKHWRS